MILTPTNLSWYWHSHIAFYHSFQGSTPLLLAAVTGRKYIVNVLISAGAEIDAPTKVGFLFTLLLNDRGIASYTPIIERFYTLICPSNIHSHHLYTLPTPLPM